jgi:hypothetical protein
LRSIGDYLLELGEVVDFYECDFGSSFLPAKSELIQGKRPVAKGVTLELRREGAVIGLTDTTPVDQGFIAKRTGWHYSHFY